MDNVYVFDLGNVIISPMNTKLLYEMLEMQVSYDQFLKFFTKSKSSIDAHKGLISDDENIIATLSGEGDLEGTLSDSEGTLEGGLTPPMVVDYGALTNKPKIEGVTLQGNKTFEDLSLSSLSNLEIENMLSM